MPIVFCEVFEIGGQAEFIVEIMVWWKPKLMMSNGNETSGKKRCIPANIKRKNMSNKCLVRPFISMSSSKVKGESRFDDDWTVKSVKMVKNNVKMSVVNLLLPSKHNVS